MFIVPNYKDGSIVNLASSVCRSRGGRPVYPDLKLLPGKNIADAKNVIVLLLDGLGYGYLEKHVSGGALRSNLRGRITSVFPSTTTAAITSLYTGVAPQQHALTGWNVYLKELGMIAMPLPYMPRGGITRLDQIMEAPIDSSKFFGLPSIFDTIHAEKYLISEKKYAASEYNRHITPKMNALFYDQSLEEMLSLIVKIVRTSSRRKYIYEYWWMFDHLEHKFGPGSFKVKQHFSEMDTFFGRLLEKLSGTDTAVIATADHGQVDIGASDSIRLADHPKFYRTLSQPFSGERRMVYCYVHPSRVREFEKYADKKLSKFCWMYKSEDLVKMGIFGNYKPNPALFDRIGDYALLMKDKYVFEDCLEGETPSDHKGSHGGVSEDEMYVPLIVTKV